MSLGAYFYEYVMNDPQSSGDLILTYCSLKIKKTSIILTKILIIIVLNIHEQATIYKHSA